MITFHAGKKSVWRAINGKTGKRRQIVAAIAYMSKPAGRDVMGAPDLHHFDALSERFPIYRGDGTATPNAVRFRFCWTHDRRVATKFGDVWAAKLKRNDALAHFSGRSEAQIVVVPGTPMKPRRVDHMRRRGTRPASA